MGTDQHWKNWGQRDPYYGVLTHAEYRRGNLDGAALEKFFQTGERRVEHVFEVLERRFGMTERPGTVVDYGCGAGRLTLPLARRADRVIGLDVADGMLDEARKNTARRGVDNIEYRRVPDDRVSVLREPVDLIHSFIVFQHIPRRRGERIFRHLLARLADGGYGAVQFTLSSPHPAWRRVAARVRDSVPVLHALLNPLQGKPLREPSMRMEEYRLARLMDILHEAGIDAVYCERTDHSGHIGAFLYFRKPPPQ